TPVPCLNRSRGAQAMGSGMTTSTAAKGRTCEGYIRDSAGLRTHPECDVVLDPNFGFLQVFLCAN
ncbi:unnamed protein product, partial [Laminaria digitata]